VQAIELAGDQARVTLKEWGTIRQRESDHKAVNHVRYFRLRDGDWMHTWDIPLSAESTFNAVLDPLLSESP
jgi:hypothetical protein